MNAYELSAAKQVKLINNRWRYVKRVQDAKIDVIEGRDEIKKEQHSSQTVSHAVTAITCDFITAKVVL